MWPDSVGFVDRSYKQNAKLNDKEPEPKTEKFLTHSFLEALNTLKNWKHVRFGLRCKRELLLLHSTAPTVFSFSFVTQVPLTF